MFFQHLKILRHMLVSQLIFQVQIHQFLLQVLIEQFLQMVVQMQQQ